MLDTYLSSVPQVNKNEEIKRLVREFLNQRYEEIETILKLWKDQIRLKLISMSAMKLSIAETNTTLDKIARYSINVPIQIIQLGVEDILRIMELDDVEQLWKLITIPKIKTALYGLQQLENNLGLFNRELELFHHDINEGNVSLLREFIQSLQGLDIDVVLERLLNEEDRKDQVRDFLGAFFHTMNNQRIELYAENIIVAAELLGVETKALAFVVLTHEMAHAYTISGYDLNGNQSDIRGSFCNKYIVEGTAQFYTDSICSQMNAKIPGVYHAFETLKNRQPPQYQWHRDWFKPFDYNYEKVRKAFLSYRNNDKMQEDEFEAYLNK